MEIDERLLERLQEVVDRQDIYDRLMRYLRGIDRNDGDLVQDVFWPDALVDHGHSAFRGEGIGPFFGDMSQHTTVHQVHHVTNIVFEHYGTEAITEAQAWYVAETERNNEPYLVHRSVRYIDRWDKRDGEWRIFHRTVPENWNMIQMVTEKYPAHPGIVHAQGDKTDISYELFRLARAGERPSLEAEAPDNRANRDHAQHRLDCAGFRAPVLDKN